MKTRYAHYMMNKGTNTKPVFISIGWKKSILCNTEITMTLFFFVGSVLRIARTAGWQCVVEKGMVKESEKIFSHTAVLQYIWGD